jgi:hypothetical protein
VSACEITCRSQQPTTKFQFLCPEVIAADTGGLQWDFEKKDLIENHPLILPEFLSVCILGLKMLV